MARSKKSPRKRRPAKSMWYFAEYGDRLRYNDGRKIKIGIAHKVKGTPIMCQFGLHASPTIRDALTYAPGPILYRVKLGGTIVKQADKSAATERTYLERINANEILHAWGRACALKMVDLWDCPRVVRDYLETGDESLRSAAESAAESAAWSAARSAARSAAESAAESAAWSAARSAAESAAWSAARSAAESAAWSAAWSAQNKLLTTMVEEALAKQRKSRKRR
jgi:hypothetical protein